MYDNSQDTLGYCYIEHIYTKLFTNVLYEGWNFNFGNTPLDWIQELLE